MEEKESKKFNWIKIAAWLTIGYLLGSGLIIVAIILVAASFAFWIALDLIDKKSDIKEGDIKESARSKISQVKEIIAKVFS